MNITVLYENKNCQGSCGKNHDSFISFYELVMLIVAEDEEKGKIFLNGSFKKNFVFNLYSCYSLFFFLVEIKTEHIAGV